MQAEKSVSFRTPEFYGTADIVKYDDNLERIIFEGTNGNYARLYQLTGQGAGFTSGDITGKQILYERKWAHKRRWRYEAIDEQSERRPLTSLYFPLHG